jgi:signal transduction histidine kinase
LSNAIKFTPPGGHITLSAEGLVGEAAEGFAAVRVRDTGLGIPPDKLHSIFDPFVQVDTSRNRTAEGTGLGLAISRELARGMGGDLVVESAIGVGSTFTLTLPRVAPVQAIAESGVESTEVG